MTYYPQMAYRTADLSPMGGLFDSIVALVTGQPAPADAPTSSAPAATNQTWAQRNSICLPLDAATLALWKDLQRQANRILARAGKTLLAVDGRIGPSTVNGVADAMTWAGNMATTQEARDMGLSWANIRGKPCTLIAANAAAVTQRLRDIANLSSAPLVADPVKSKPSQPAPGGGVSHPSQAEIEHAAMPGMLDGVFGFLPAEVRVPLGLASLAVGGLLIHKAMKGGKGQRRRSSSRARRPARRRGRR